jgi:hypothetical protein
MNRPPRPALSEPLAEQREDDLLWIREEFLQRQQYFGKFLVHGHTPVRHPELLKPCQYRHRCLCDR